MSIHDVSVCVSGKNIIFSFVSSKLAHIDCTMEMAVCRMTRTDAHLVCYGSYAFSRAEQQGPTHTRLTPQSVPIIQYTRSFAKCGHAN